MDLQAKSFLLTIGVNFTLIVIFVILALVINYCKRRSRVKKQLLRQSKAAARATEAAKANQNSGKIFYTPQQDRR